MGYLPVGGEKMSEPYDTLDRRWRTSCATILRQEVGPLSDYEKWLREDILPQISKKSSVSGKTVTFSHGEYHADTKCAALEETNLLPAPSALDINQLKDIESIKQALAERFYYTGDIVLGNSAHIKASSNINDSFYVQDSVWVGDSKYVAYCTRARLSEDCFGTHMAGESACTIKCHGEYRNKRCFELWQGQNCSDCYYSHRLEGCQECLFCFNLYNQHHRIGNLQMERAKYQEIKAHLLAQMVDELKKNKRLPSLVELIEKTPVKQLEQTNSPRFDQVNAQAVLKTIDNEFARTCQLLLGQKLSNGIEDYGDWLAQSIPPMRAGKSAMSGQPVDVIHFANYDKLPKDRLLKLEEAKLYGESHQMDEKELIGFDWYNAADRISRIAFFCPEVREGTNMNILRSPASFESSYVYKAMAGFVRVKYSAFVYWLRDCENVFGSSDLFDSRFCIHCESSVNLSRCFEVDSSRACSDCYFCHNVEDCAECMFCFNAKSKRYAIGNVEYPKEEYLRVKKRVMAQMADRLEKDKTLQWSIFDIGKRRD